jgi:hypothetical protein
MMRSWTRRNGSNPLGSLSLHPRCGKIRADVNQQIIQNSPYAEGGARSKIRAEATSQPRQFAATIAARVGD